MADVSKIKLIDGSIKTIKDAALRTEFDRIMHVTDAAIDDLSDIEALNNLDIAGVCSDGGLGGNVQHIYTDFFDGEEGDYISVPEMASEGGYSVSEFQALLPNIIGNEELGSKRFTNTGNSIIYDGVECIIFEVGNHYNGEGESYEDIGAIYYALMPTYISLSMLQNNSIKTNAYNHMNPFIAGIRTDNNATYTTLERIDATGLAVLGAE